jgi:DNA-binding MarR family transcriptional regulator
VGATRAKSKKALATDIWRTMAGFALARVQRGPHLAILREMGLTPGHLKALSVLDPDEPRPMKAMSDALMCDPSMATWFVDRLEEKGLVERGSSPSDRRVKTVVLTPKGVQTRAQVSAALFEPPEELLALDGERLEALNAALAALPIVENPFWHSGPPKAVS